MTQLETPWWRGAVIYQIYPRSFRDSNGDGVGDLPGITEKLDYVAALGVDGVWLSPFFRSPMKDFGYDVSDYRDVDPVFGTLADFDALLARAHALGLKVIIDQVYSHTSDQHPWFLDSRASAESTKSDWYIWAPAKADGAPPNNWQATFGGPAWTWSPLRRLYYMHGFLPQQPDLNIHNPAVREALLAVTRFWLDRGVDGLRLDVINHVAHDPRLTDNPPSAHSEPPERTYLFQRHIHDKSRPEALTFVEALRAVTDGYDDRMMVGEIFDDDELVRQQEYTDGPSRLHTAYSFHLIGGRPGDPSLFAQAVEAWRGASGWPSWSIGNHDVARYPTRMAGTFEGSSLAQTHALLAALFALRGTLFLYQGDELGLPQGRVEFDDLQDPFAKAAFTGDSGRDGARTPFPWDSAAPMADFTTASHSWLPLDPAHTALSAADQASDPSSTLAFTRRLIALRRRSPALRLGEAQLAPAPKGCFAVRRSAGEEQVLCAVNLSDRSVNLPLGAGDGAEVLLAQPGVILRDEQLHLPPFGVGFIRGAFPSMIPRA